MDNEMDAGHLNITHQMATASPSIVLNMTSNEYCGSELDSFRKGFIAIYGNLTTVVCSVGMLTNIINILVLTRKTMSRSATNAILTGIAVADLLFLIFILTFTLLSYDVIKLEPCIMNSYGLQLFSLFTIRSALTMHSISVMLTLVLAIWRYIAVTFPLKIREWCSMYRTTVAIIACYVLVPISNLMLYLSRTVQQVKKAESESSTFSINVGQSQNQSGNCSVYRVVYTELAELGNGTFKNVGFWIYGGLFKILPSIALLVFSLILIKVLYESSQQRMKLTQSSTGSRLDRSTERTTKMLLAVLLLFLITELPQGVLLLLNAMLGNSFYDSCYTDLVEVNDLLEILNSTLNFAFYFAMSKQFRRTFLCLFTPKAMTERGSTKSQDSTVTQLETHC